MKSLRAAEPKRLSISLPNPTLRPPRHFAFYDMQSKMFCGWQRQIGTSTRLNDPMGIDLLFRVLEVDYYSTVESGEDQLIEIEMMS